MLLSLPDELLLHILNYYILQDKNHTALIPVARTCRGLCALTLDWALWSGPVNIIIPKSSSYTTKDLYGILEQSRCFKKKDWRTTHLTLAVEDTNACTFAAELLQQIIQRQQQPLTSMQVHVPCCIHPILLKQSYFCKEAITLRDAHDDHWSTTTTTTTTTSPIIIDHDTLPLSSTLKSLDVPTCSIDNWMRDHHRIFPQLEKLSARLTTEIDGKQLKRIFPCLKQLELHLEFADDVSLLRPLLTDKQLYPWLESLHVVCKDDLRLRLGQDEIEQVLRSLDGMSRLSIGWDMVVIDAL
ncbi:hypothetical protein O0I10_008070 [Lichtheimia ornata]|uniref:F-box domain-containing protein n=1 Tax=Lichtheimia ornata TaxID=688661 RepID=A0AAD7V238_9FUNG|nr:uncharacterized protein O0I10_008070 [Lichtheimia ornata]KAJ8656276.1 hypothetical protein O0I10_008070 [Lichtheimia ornata]